MSHWYWWLSVLWAHWQWGCISRRVWGARERLYSREWGDIIANDSIFSSARAPACVSTILPAVIRISVIIRMRCMQEYTKYYASHIHAVTRFVFLLLYVHYFLLSLTVFGVATISIMNKYCGNTNRLLCIISTNRMTITWIFSTLYSYLWNFVCIFYILWSWVGNSFQNFVDRPHTSLHIL